MAAKDISLSGLSGRLLQGRKINGRKGRRERPQRAQEFITDLFVVGDELKRAFGKYPLTPNGICANMSKKRRRRSYERQGS